MVLVISEVRDVAGYGPAPSVVRTDKNGYNEARNFEGVSIIVARNKAIALALPWTARRHVRTAFEALGGKMKPL